MAIGISGWTLHSVQDLTVSQASNLQRLEEHDRSLMSLRARMLELEAMMVDIRIKQAGLR